MPHGTVDAGIGTSGKTSGEMMQKNDFADAGNTLAMTRGPHACQTGSFVGQVWLISYKLHEAILTSVEPRDLTREPK